MSALSKLEKELGLPKFDLSFFEETKVDEMEGTEKTVSSKPQKISKKTEIKSDTKQINFANLMNNLYKTGV